MKPQTRLVLNYLKAGRKITTFIAINSLGVASLSSRVAELRRMKYSVSDEWAKDYHGARYKRYRLEAERAWNQMLNLHQRGRDE